MPQKISEFITDVIGRMVGAPFPDTVDTVKVGDVEQPLRGVVCTFMATREVLDQAVALGANLVITHEPTFYNHRDETEWLAGDPVFIAKRRFAEERGLVIWRCHDYIHSMQRDGIYAGVVRQLGWHGMENAAHRHVYKVPRQTLRELAEYLKARLGIPQVKVVGDLGLQCSVVALKLGASGGRGQIQVLRDSQADVVVCGESPEWETCEYVRDAAPAGKAQALIVLGHANSEEAGMEWLAEWLRPAAPEGVQIHFVKAGDPFAFV